MEGLGSTRMSMELQARYGCGELCQSRKRSKLSQGHSDRAEREILEVQSSGLAFKIDVQPRFGNPVCRSVRGMVLSVTQQRGVI